MAKYFLMQATDEFEAPTIIGRFGTLEDAENALLYISSEMEKYQEDIKNGRKFINSLIEKKYPANMYIELNEEEYSEYCKILRLEEDKSEKYKVIVYKIYPSSVHISIHVNQTTIIDLRESLYIENKLRLQEKSFVFDDFYIKKETEVELDDEKSCFYNLF